VSRTEFPAVLAILTAFGLWVSDPLRLNLTGDDAFSAYLAAQGPAEILRQTLTGEPHPPLYYLGLSGWTALAGRSEFALRYLSVLVTLPTLPIIYVLARRVWGPGSARFALLLAAPNPLAYWAAHAVRMYGPLMTLSGAALLGAVAFAQKPTWRRAALAAATAGLAALVHYYGLFTLATLGLWGLAVRPRNFRAWILIHLLAAGVCLTWLAVARQVSLGYNQRPRLDPAGILFRAVEFLAGQTLGLTVIPDWPQVGTRLLFGPLSTLTGTAPPLLPVLVGLGAGAGAAGLLTAAVGRPDALRTLLLLQATLPLVVGAGVSLFRPMLEVRYLTGTLPAFLALAAGFVRPGHRLGLVPGLGALAWLGLSLVGLLSFVFNPIYDRVRYRELVRYIADHALPGEAIVLDGWSQQFLFWYYGRELSARADLAVFLLPTEHPIDEAATLAALEGLARDRAGIWLIDTDTRAYDPRLVVERWLTAHWYRAFERWFGNNRLVYFAPPVAESPRPAEIDFPGAGIRLVEYALTPPTGRFDLYRLRLRWRAEPGPRPDAKLSLRLVDGQGNVVWSLDTRPQAGFRPTPAWGDGETVDDCYGIAVPAGTPPESYRLELVLYDPATLAAFPAGGRSTLDLGEIAVGPPTSTPLVDPAVDRPIGAAVAGGLLAGISGGPPAAARPGDTLRFELVWSGLPGPLEAEVSLAGGGGELLARTAQRVGPGRWARQFVALRVPAGAIAGTARLGVRAGGREVPLGEVEIVPVSRTAGVPADATAVGVLFGGVVRLDAYRLSLAPGSGPGERALDVTLFWSALGEIPKAYHVSVQVIGPDGRLLAQHDGIPAGGERPMTGWVPGEVVVDAHRLVLKSDGTLYVIVYDPKTGDRLAPGAVALARLD
jgi:hypothetical protein